MGFRRRTINWQAKVHMGRMIGTIQISPYTYVCTCSLYPMAATKALFFTLLSLIIYIYAGYFLKIFTNPLSTFGPLYSVSFHFPFVLIRCFLLCTFHVPIYTCHILCFVLVVPCPPQVTLNGSSYNLRGRSSYG